MKKPLALMIFLLGFLTACSNSKAADDKYYQTLKENIASCKNMASTVKAYAESANLRDWAAGGTENFIEEDDMYTGQMGDFLRSCGDLTPKESIPISNPETGDTNYWVKTVPAPFNIGALDNLMKVTQDQATYAGRLCLDVPSDKSLLPHCITEIDSFVQDLNKVELEFNNHWTPAP